MQFINKKDFKQITEQDMAKFRAIQQLLGLSLDNTSEVHTTMNVTISIKENFRSIENIIQSILMEETEQAKNELQLDKRMENIN